MTAKRLYEIAATACYLGLFTSYISLSLFFIAAEIFDKNRNSEDCICYILLLGFLCIASILKSREK